MAQKVGAPKIIGTHRSDRLLSRSSQLGGRGRYTILTAFDLGLGITGVTQELFSQEFSREFFKSIGDRLIFTFWGTLNAAAAQNIELFVEFLDETGTSLGIALLSPVIAGATGNVPFYATGSIYLNSDKNFGGAGQFLSEYPADPISINRFPASIPFVAKKLVVKVIANIGAASSLLIEMFHMEFSPAVIT